MAETNVQVPQEPGHPEESVQPIPEAERKNVSREPLLGGLLLGALILFALLALAGIAWAIYGGVTKQQAASSEPSITSLEKETEAPQEEAATPVTATTSPASDTATPASSAPANAQPGKTTVVSVLNGGAAGGSAGKLAATLRQEGYTQVTARDATGNYTGVVIYHAANLSAEAETLKTAVAKTYPNVTIAPAIASNKATSTSPLTVIIGR